MADPGGISRRRWLQLMGASLALAGVSGCRWKEQEILSFAKRPEGRTPGVFSHFTTAIPQGDSALGLLVTKVDGRPIKIEGSPRHPQSLGATDTQAQAAILDLYDPDRSRKLYRREGEKETEETWDTFDKWSAKRFGRLHENEGSGFCVLAEASSSPTLDALRAELLETFPQARWFEYEPVGDDNQRAGAVLAFGRPLRTHWALETARVILCLDADPLGSHPAAVPSARGFAAGREAAPQWMSRMYVVESCFSLTGAAADHRLPLPSSQIPAFAGRLESELASRLAAADTAARESPINKAAVPAAAQLGHIQRFLRAVVDDLLENKNRGRSVVCAGETQPPEVHAAVHRINALLGNTGKTVKYTQVPNPRRPTYVEAIKALAGEMRTGKVATLLLLGGNPAYDAPADLAFGEALRAVKTTIHLSLYRNETSRQCTWHLPKAHFLEAWGDARSYDGTYSVLQPMIEPLSNGRSPIEVLALILGSAAKDRQPPSSAVDLVRRTFNGIVAAKKITWEETLRDGFLPGTRWPVESVSKPEGLPLPTELAEVLPENGKLEVVFRRSAAVHDGRFANNSWLQELPDPMTKLTWGNAALVGPATAKALSIENETWIALQVGDHQVRIPASIMPGMAAGTVAVDLGYGRTAAGNVGGDCSAGVEPVGVDVYPLRTSAAMTLAAGATIEPSDTSCRLASTQDHFAIDAVGRNGRNQRLGSLVRQSTWEHYRQHPDFARHAEEHPPLESLWKEHVYEGRRWGMAIDLSKCIGCGACVLACQAENNIPVVGKDQVCHGREMHWIRVDRYFRGAADDPQAVHQPVPCQQCELAPCEQVCPVAATSHSSEGLNDMAYNRCVGTRYCANNCPYKVRRFNYFNFHKEMENPAREIAKMRYNPQVTIRSRGVMEKCTYCVQRIQTAKIEARVADREITDGEIRTACQQVCPAGAIVFGDLADAKSAVRKLHASDRAYALLAELETRPRTVYLARIRNPNPQLESADEHHDGDIG